MISNHIEAICVKEMSLALTLHKSKATQVSRFPRCVKLCREETEKVMKFVKKLLFTFVLIGGLSVAGMAQKDDRQKPPPKGGNTPVVVPREKPPKENPKGGEKPKKPGMAFEILSFISRETGE